jgi:hypothetical protein
MFLQALHLAFRQTQGMLALQKLGLVCATRIIDSMENQSGIDGLSTEESRLSSLSSSGVKS